MAFKATSPETFTVKRLSDAALHATIQQQDQYLQALKLHLMKPIDAMKLKSNL